MKRIIHGLKNRKKEPSHKIKIMRSFSLLHNEIKILTKENIPACMTELHRLIKKSGSYKIDQKVINLSKTCLIEQMKKFSAVKNDAKRRTSTIVAAKNTKIQMHNATNLEFSYDLRPHQEKSNCFLVGHNSKIVHKDKEIFIIKFEKKDKNGTHEKTAMIIHIHLS